MNLVATLNLRSGSFDLLPHLLRHLRDLRVGHVVLTCNIFYTPDHEGIEQCAPDGLSLSVARYSLPHGGQTNDDRMEDEQRDRLLNLLGVPYDAWLMPLDLDEFHAYPAPLGDVLGVADARGMDIVKGRLIDRFAVGGVLAPLQPDVPIEQQYPIETEFTRTVLGGYTQKVMLCRRRVKLGTGHHNANGWAGTPVGDAGHYLLHHFKWRAGLLERIRHTLDNSFASEAYRREAVLFLSMVRDGAVCLPLN